MRILVAEDDPVSGRMLQSLLGDWGYEVVLVRDGNKAWDALQRDDAPQLAVIDWIMPGMDGVALCRKLRQQAREPYVYVVLLTGKGQKEDTVKGLDAGADDYITKPFDPSELKVRLRAGRRILDLQAQLITVREALYDQATHDPLTGLLNRAAILDIIEQETVRVRREGLPLAVAMADLDHFKEVNDHHGHMAGDAVIREVARRFRASVRPYDTVARYGGEEFLFVLPGCDESGAASLAERIRAAIAAKPMNTSEGIIPVTVSIGVATSVEVPLPAPERLIASADAALYEAKRGGRNRIEIAAGNRTVTSA